MISKGDLTVIFFNRKYQMQTNLFMQISIWIIGTSKGHGRLDNSTINHPPLITLLQIPLPLLLRCPLDVDLVAYIEVCT